MKKILMAGACAATLAACSPVPSPQFAPASSEQVVASAAHWHAIASDFAAALAPQFKDEAAVLRPVQSTQFSEAFGDMLSSELTERGARIVSRGPVPPVHVRYTLELVQNGYAPRPMPRHSMEPLGDTGVWTHHVDGEHHEGRVRSSASDFPASGPITEIVLTGTVERGGIDLASVSRVYYVRGTDAVNYLPPPPPPPPPAAVPMDGRNRVVIIDRYGERSLILPAPLR